MVEYLKQEEAEFLRDLELYIDHTKRIILNNEDTRRDARRIYNIIRHGPLPRRLSRISPASHETADILGGGLVPITWNPGLIKHRPKVLEIQKLDIDERYEEAVKEAEGLLGKFVKEHLNI